MNFNAALVALATYLSLDAVTLADYAATDPHGGRDTGWSVMSMTRDEGRILYALTRALQPDTVVEVGTAQGCSTTHFLQAVVDNPSGSMISIDPADNVGIGIPLPLTDRWEWRRQDGEAGLVGMRTYGEHPDIILEDSLHYYEHTKRILSVAISLNPHLLICHDVIEYPGVAQAWAEVVGDKGLTFTVGDAPAGMGVYKP